MHHDTTRHESESAPTDIDAAPQRAEEGTHQRPPRCEMRDVTVSESTESPRRYYEF